MNYLDGIHWIHHSNFRIEYEDRIIYIDPWKLDESKQADLVFITHEHSDHCSPRDIMKIAKPSTLVICPERCAKRLKGFNLRVVKPDDKFEVNSISCEVVPAYNNRLPFHSKKYGYVGYILGLKDLHIYHAGDTDFIPEMKAFKNITIAMVPIGGFMTMGVNEAALAVKAINPKIAIPIHYGSYRGINRLLFNNNPDQFVKQIKSYGIDATIMKEEQDITHN